MGKNGDATASGLNFVPRRFAVWARPVGESVSFEALSQACLERSASACLFRRQCLAYRTCMKHAVHEHILMENKLVSSVRGRC